MQAEDCATPLHRSLRVLDQGRIPRSLSLARADHETQVFSSIADFDARPFWGHARNPGPQLQKVKRNNGTSTVLATLICKPDIIANSANILAIAKKKVGVTDDGRDVYEPGGVRPLNVTNTDNRLLASAARAAIEPTLETLITEDQRGFLGADL